MGYTNYWIRTEKPITQSFVDAVKSIVSEANKMGISIRDGYGENKPIVTLDEVNFNGNAEKNLTMKTFYSLMKKVKGVLTFVRPQRNLMIGLLKRY